MMPSLLAYGELEQNMKALNTKVAEINKKTSEVFVQELDPDYTELRTLLFKAVGTEPITEEISLIA